MKTLGEPQVFWGRAKLHKGGADGPKQRDACGTEKEGHPYFGGRSWSLAGGDHQPQNEQCGCYGGRSDNSRKGFKNKHLDRSYIITSRSR
jgi:hypothetical protein